MRDDVDPLVPWWFRPSTARRKPKSGSSLAALSRARDALTMKLLATDLRGKTVMSDEGLMLGRLRNVTTDEKTGDLTDVLVEPGEDVDPRLFRRDQRGYLVFPFENVRSLRDVIVVSTVNATY